MRAYSFAHMPIRTSVHPRTRPYERACILARPYARAFIRAHVRIYIHTSRHVYRTQASAQARIHSMHNTQTNTNAHFQKRYIFIGIKEQTLSLPFRISLYLLVFFICWGLDITQYLVTTFREDGGDASGEQAPYGHGLFALVVVAHMLLMSQGTFDVLVRHIILFVTYHDIYVSNAHTCARTCTQARAHAHAHACISILCPSRF